MSDILKFANAIRVGVLASAPSGAENGVIYYDSGLGKFQIYQGGSFTDISASDVVDNVFRIVDNGDATKKIAFEASGITTSTTRTITMPDANVSLADVNNAILKNGSRAFTADQSLGGFKITNLANPTGDQDAATKFYVDSLSAGLDPKASVRAATTAALPAVTYNNGASGVGATLTANSNGALPAQDGVTLVVGNRLMVKNQAAALQNGIYTVTVVGDGSTAFVLTRATDQDGSPSSEVSGGNYCFVEQGTVQSGRGYVVIADGDIVVGTDAINWTQFSDTASPVTSVNGQTGAVILVTDDIAEDGSPINLWFTDARAKAAAVADAIVNGVTDVAPSQNAVFDALALKLENVVEDTTPQLGGDLDLNGHNVLGNLNRAALGSPSNFIQEEYIHGTTLTASQTDTVLSALGFAHASFEGQEVTYKIKEASTNRVRIGTLRIVTDGTNISLTDTYNETADVGVSWSAVVNGANIDVRYTSTANNKTLRADIKRIAA